MKICSLCKEFVDVTEFDKHKKVHDMGDVNFLVPFPNLVIRLGPGHIEMNMAHKLPTFLWVPFMIQIAVALGFRTPNAQKVFRLGINHHRSRQVIENVLLALSRELTTSYVRYSISIGKRPTAAGYLSWYKESVLNQNYAFYFM